MGDEYETEKERDEKNVRKFGKAVANEFILSQYPGQPFSLVNEIIDIGIRIPPYIEELRNQYPTPREFVEKVICIEEISITEEYRGMGAFRSVLRELASKDFDYIVVGHVTQEYMISILEKNGWTRFEEFFNPLPTFYMSSKELLKKLP
ncbi:hypothetical protein [Thiomicrospira sp. WB1]|uniref:hypothetical protein n=1 Tax=Thiomicrospira sp. WB1 TaxID=1685380 RepID=UPI00074B2BB3|nr:hypothetical protein [Thiomicrospira sp. WB1]KUJ71665.1 hypothetical protein AVO41_09130 [Thiomicrospira sp. WB1]